MTKGIQRCPTWTMIFYTKVNDVDMSESEMEEMAAEINRRLIAELELANAEGSVTLGNVTNAQC